MASRIIVVRHGNTFDKGDVVTRVGGRTDLPLSVSGRVQAEALARHFATTAFATARSGPLKRTRETAAAILAAQANPPELTTDLFLREIDYGPDENRPEEEVIARIGKAALDAWNQKDYGSAVVFLKTVMTLPEAQLQSAEVAGVIAAMQAELQRAGQGGNRSAQQALQDLAQ